MTVKAPRGTDWRTKVWSWERVLERGRGPPKLMWPGSSNGPYRALPTYEHIMPAEAKSQGRARLLFPEHQFYREIWGNVIFKNYACEFHWHCGVPTMFQIQFQAFTIIDS